MISSSRNRFLFLSKNNRSAVKFEIKHELPFRRKVISTAVAEHFGARWGIALGGLAALVAGAFAARTLLKNDRSEVVPESIRTADLEAEGREEAKFK